MILNRACDLGESHRCPSAPMEIVLIVEQALHLPKGNWALDRETDSAYRGCADQVNGYRAIPSVYVESAEKGSGCG